MTATEELRRMLDERGVEWRADDVKTVWVTRWVFDGHSSAMFSNYDDGECVFVTSGHSWTPEQAVAATLGPGTCKDATSDDHTQAFTCSECGCWVAYDEYWETGIYVEGDGQAVHIHPHYCPNCGRRVEYDSLHLH